MSDQPCENIDNYYTTAVLPLTEEDKQVIKKVIKNYYQVNVLLLPLLAIIFFWGLLYFVIFLIFVLWYNISAFSSIAKNEQSLDHPKIILTGKITKKESPGEEMVFYLGSERFDVTYANITYSIEVGDTVSLHYSQFNIQQSGTLTQQRGELLRVEKEN